MRIQVTMELGWSVYRMLGTVKKGKQRCISFKPVSAFLYAARWKVRRWEEETRLTTLSIVFDKVTKILQGLLYFCTMFYSFRSTLHILLTTCRHGQGGSILLVFPLGSWGSPKFSDLPKVIQLASETVQGRIPFPLRTAVFHVVILSPQFC